jgi:uncharacterized protein (DUF2236 family)
VGDAGLFGPDSVAWRLHGHPVMLVGGLRALLVQALEPRAMAAVDQHGRFREDPWGRLARTTSFVVDTTYGDTVHTRIHGVDPVTGRSYRADDPDLLLWIHAVEVDSFLLAYRAFAGPLSRADGDRYVAEMARVAEMVELPAPMAPRSEADLRDYLRSVRGLQVTPAARDGLRVILFPPMHLALRPLWAIPTTAAVSILPTYARRMYRLPWVPGAGVPVRAGVFALGRALRVLRPTPPAVRAALERIEGRAA